jgi:hypothetical protein
MDQSVYLNCYEHLFGFDTKIDMHLTDEFSKNLDFLPLMRTLLSGPHATKPS